jgi:hypothetical protein
MRRLPSIVSRPIIGETDEVNLGSPVERVPT